MTERYGRHALIDWFSQDHISGLSVAVVGAGAVGNEVLKNLALLGAGRIQIYDFDRIESHNLTKSILFREADIGLEKSVVAAERAMSIDPNIRCVAHVGDFWNLISLAEASQFDAIFCCVDNFEARVHLNALCFLAETDLVNVGIDSRFSSIEIFPFSASQSSGCYECGLPSTAYQRISERYSCGHLRKAAFVEKKVPTTAITSSVGAALAVSTGLGLGQTGVPAPFRLLIDTILGISNRAELTRKLDCPCCGRFPIEYKLIECRPWVGSLLAAGSHPVRIEFSDPILVSYTIRSTGVTQVVFKRASDFDDTFPASVHANPAEIDVDIRDQFDAKELSECFNAYRIPSKFAVIYGEGWTVIADFVGGLDE